MKKNKIAVPKPYEIPSGFCIACDNDRTTTQRALQQFAHAISIPAYVERKRGSLSGLACSFLRYCLHDAQSEYHREVQSYTHWRSAQFLAELEAVRQSHDDAAGKQQAIECLVNRWHKFMDYNRAVDFMFSLYPVLVPREFLMLCDALALNSDYVLFLYMANVNQEHAYHEAGNMAGIATRFYSKSVEKWRKAIFPALTT